MKPKKISALMLIAIFAISCKPSDFFYEMFKPPVLIAPTEGETLATANPTLSWTMEETQGTVDSFRIIIDDQLYGIVESSNQSSIKYEYTVEEELTAGEYKWKIIASNDFQLYPSVVWKFFVELETTLDDISLVSPSDGSSFCSEENIELIWTSADNAYGYQLNVTDQSGTTIIDESITQTSFPINPTLEAGTYAWYVTPLFGDSGVKRGDPTETWTFSIQELVDPVPLNISDGCNGDTFVFEWSGDGPDYEVQLDDDIISGVENWISSPNYISGTSVSETISTNGFYKFRVRSVDGPCVSDWVESDEFEVEDCTPPCTIITIPDTGQTTSYEDYDDWYYTDPGINPMNYSDNTPAAGIVTDNVTGLQWEKDTGTDTKSWVDAGTYCNDLTLGGFEDWRLPTLFELSMITDYETQYPSIDPIFINTQFNSYWTSQKYEGNLSQVWTVDFSYGFNAFITATIPFNYRCVRVIICESDFSRNDPASNGEWVVEDASSGLMWADDTSILPMTWVNAIDYCENGIGGSGTYAGYGDWRLPNIKELQSIVDLGEYNPAINTTMFNNYQSDTYWSSTSLYSDIYHAWNINFLYGSNGQRTRVHTFYVRCVRYADGT